VRRRNKPALALALTLTAAAPLAVADEFADGEAVMQAVFDQARRHANQSAEVELVSVDSGGRERARGFRYLHKILPQRTKSLIKFHRPASVKGTGLLSETPDDADRATQWIYLPALRAVKRLNADDQNNSFIGSDFSNGDIAGRQVSRDNHEITSQDAAKIHIRSTPKDAGDAYSRIDSVVLRDILVPERIVFYDRNGDKLKTLSNKRVRKIDGMYLVVEAVMTNHQSGGATRLTKTRIDLARDIDPRRVGMQGLRM